MIHALRFSLWTLLLAVLALTGCQSAPPKGLTPEQIAVLKREGFTPTDEGWAYDLSGKVLFGSDLDGLNGQSQAIVERIGKALLGVGIQGVRVDGHADSSGKAAYNQQLSERRAQSVTRALVGVGMQAQNIQSRGLGSTQPVADNRTSAGRTENRRVSIVVASY
ncbi:MULTISPECIES: OmpA family protein [Pseudomonas]|uniref:Cell envelope biogenesis protein OmpA n=2 Tax=Pseudomonas TaxID=286 RepID=A0A1L7NJN0_PSEPU|nr:MULTISPECIES: OmpA family protein [Pseudomonas]ERT20376.1 membrane protein [Pseudomonas putida SJ3]MBP2081114.1 outer membrane protein OmpA-like peptidoglycan-associated protein [Pseudomonas sp. PvP089]MBP2087269.1 outer membrane protein OmpA-like peptidoglycan-associated protein [Pseudomonas sp. PvP088]MCE0781230.1 OmpA family protein [Pseudomonas sp. NMI542_15]MCE0965904.1 OmpA family protein [Pseudomonas sp. NMI4491_12]PNB54205.1 OmpA family protein [Pseudomonas sp. FW305-130]